MAANASRSRTARTSSSTTTGRTARQPPVVDARLLHPATVYERHVGVAEVGEHPPQAAGEQSSPVVVDDDVRAVRDADATHHGRERHARRRLRRPGRTARQPPVVDARLLRPHQRVARRRWLGEVDRREPADDDRRPGGPFGAIRAPPDAALARHRGRRARGDRQGWRAHHRRAHNGRDGRERYAQQQAAGDCALSGRGVLGGPARSGAQDLQAGRRATGDLRRARHPARARRHRLLSGRSSVRSRSLRATSHRLRQAAQLPRLLGGVGQPSGAAGRAGRVDRLVRTVRPDELPTS